MVVGAQDRDILEEQGVEAVGEGEVVVGPQRALAQVGKGGAGHAADRAGQPDLPAQHVESGLGLGLVAAQTLPQGVEPGPPFGVGRGVPRRGRGEGVDAPVPRACDLDPLAAGLDKVDEGDEELAVDPVQIQVLRPAVRGDGQHHLVLEQGLEQATEDQGIGDIGDLKLVKAQQPRFGGDQDGDRSDRIIALPLAEGGLARPLVALAPAADQAMDARQEGVEVGALLPGLLHLGEEQVHQHGLAASGRAVEIDAAHLGHPAEQAAPAQVLLQPGEGLEGRVLTRIGLEDAVFQLFRVGAFDTGSHGSRLAGARGTEKRLRGAGE